MLRFVWVLQKEVGTLGASDVTRKLRTISVNLWPHALAKHVNDT
jgi:hypothetical protein